MTTAASPVEDTNGKLPKCRIEKQNSVTIHNMDELHKHKL